MNFFFLNFLEYGVADRAVHFPSHGYDYFLAIPERPVGKRDARMGWWRKFFGKRWWHNTWKFSIIILRFFITFFLIQLHILYHKYIISFYFSIFYLSNFTKISVLCMYANCNQNNSNWFLLFTLSPSLTNTSDLPWDCHISPSPSILASTSLQPLHHHHHRHLHRLSLFPWLSLPFLWSPIFLSFAPNHLSTTKTTQT